MNSSPKFLAVALAIAVTPWLAAPAAAAPLSSSLVLQSAPPGPSVETVQYRRGWRGGYRGGYGRGFAGAGIGFAAGALLGGAIVGSQPYGYYGYGGYGPDYDQAYVISPGVEGGEVAYCQQRFRSYDVRSGTYLGFDGLRHSCP
jgi:MFS family permease